MSFVNVNLVNRCNRLNNVTYPVATQADIEFFQKHGWIVVENAIDPADLETVEKRCDWILENKERVAFDWAWAEGTSRDQRAFKILQASPTWHDPEINNAPFRRWAVAFASTLMSAELEFWYDQFLAKPPHNKTPTYWHQDEGYWGRNLDERGITCWTPFHDVDVGNGCMHFIDGGHKVGVLAHRQVDGVQSDLLCCEPDETDMVACPINLGGVTFHHGKTPHMTTANSSDEWRRILTQHMKIEGCQGEGDHYPWKIYVNQFTGERTTPNTS